MRADRKLNLVIPIERPGGKIYVHSTPIGREVFERHFLIMAKTFAAIWDEGLHITVGPRVAALMLKRIAERHDVWTGPEGIEAGLMAEIRRLSNVSLPEARGWDIIPFQEAIDAGKLDEDEIAEVEGELIFFTLECCLRKRAHLEQFLIQMTRLWNSQTTLLDATAYSASLPISTQDANTGAKAKASSIPR